MDSLWVIDMIIPKHGIIRNVGPRVSLVAAVHGGELNGVANEEDGEVIEDKVLDAILGVELG